jgi:hypothetical protein
MKKLYMFFIPVLALAFVCVAYGAENEETAKSWQEQATSTRAQVMSVYEELQQMGDKDNPAAKDLIADAVTQLGEGDKFLAKGDEAMEAQEWEKANFGYNMAWQYYVKAATAGLNAKSILSGQ